MKKQLLLWNERIKWVLFCIGVTILLRASITVVLIDKWVFKGKLFARSLGGNRGYKKYGTTITN